LVRCARASCYRADDDLLSLSAAPVMRRDPCSRVQTDNYFSGDLHQQRPVRLAYQPPASSTFLSEQTSHQQPASSTLLSEQISTSHQPPANRTGCTTGGRKPGRINLLRAAQPAAPPISNYPSASPGGRHRRGGMRPRRRRPDGGRSGGVRAVRGCARVSGRQANRSQAYRDRLVLWGSSKGTPTNPVVALHETSEILSHLFFQKKKSKCFLILRFSTVLLEKRKRPTRYGMSRPAGASTYGRTARQKLTYHPVGLVSRPVIFLSL
jgi:hypothetical protein